MEVNFLQGLMMNLRFGRAERIENRNRPLLGPIAQSRRVLNDFHDMRQMAMGFLLPAIYVELRRADAAAFRLFKGISGAQVQRIKRVKQRRAVRARVDQCADGHVAADAGKCVEIAGFHGDKLAPLLSHLRRLR